METRKVKAFVMLPLIALYLLPVLPGNVGYTQASAWWTHFIYMFFHANVWHLAINLWAFYFLVDGIKKPASTVVAGYLSSLCLSFLPFAFLPVTVGFSGILFFMTGCIYARVKNIKSWGLMLALLSIGFFQAGINIWLHITSFISGLVYSLALIEYSKFEYDRKRYTARKQEKV